MSLSERVPPQNLEAEQAVLGSILIDKEAFTKVADILKSDDYYREAHQWIYQSGINLFSRNEPIDLITISDELTKLGRLESTGGRTYLIDLSNSIPTTANVEHYARIIKEKAMLRKLITHSYEIASKAYTEGADVNAILDLAQKSVFNISEHKNHKCFVRVVTLLEAVFMSIDNKIKLNSNISGIASGYYDLDKMTGGFQPADLIVLAARPSMGKTAFALNIAQNMAINNKHPVAIFSMEMPKELLIQRLLCSEAEIDSVKLKNDTLADNDFKKLGRALGKLAEAPIFIDDTPSLTPVELHAKARKLKIDENIALIIIDFLQLMKGAGSVQNRTQEVSEIIKGIKTVARELNIPIIALSQLNRGIEFRDDKTPKLSDIRESGEIEQVADIVMFIHREDYYNQQALSNKAQLIIAKHRNGATGAIDLIFKKEITKFLNKSREEGGV